MPAPPSNKSSDLLDNDENNLVFSLLGPKCVSMATTVAQMYFARDTTWHHQATGVLCFVRDANVRSFFLRFYDLEQRRMSFEQEIYRNMNYNNQYNFFHQFEADQCVVGFNFVDDDRGQDEAHELVQVLKEKVQKMSPPQGGRQQELQTTPIIIGHKANTVGGTLPAPMSTSTSAPGKKGAGKSAGKIDKGKGGAGRGKIRREDIGMPTHFRHVQHVGYDNLEADAGQIQRLEISDDPALKFLFGAIGEDFEKTMQSKKGARKVEKLVAGMGGMDRMREMATEVGYAPAPGSQPPQPPPPPRAAQQQPRGPPPAPPPGGRSAPPPPPPPPPPARPVGVLPQPPLASPPPVPQAPRPTQTGPSYGGGGSAPPPPPPPPPPPAPSAPNSGAPRPPPASRESVPAPTEQRSFLSDIRSFNKDKLRNAATDSEPKSPAPVSASGGGAGGGGGAQDMLSALKAAMRDINKGVQGNDSDSEDDNDDEEWDDD